MSGKKKSSFISAVALLVSLLMIALAVGLVFNYTKASEKIEDLLKPAFCVKYDGKDYNGEDNAITLPSNGKARFKVTGADRYTVTLTSNVTYETDFLYEVGDTVSYFSKADLSKAFIGNDSTKNGDFYLNCLEDYSLESVLSKVHDGAEIKLNGGVSSPYLLIFSDGIETVSFTFGYNVKIVLSENVIIF